MGLFSIGIGIAIAAAGAIGGAVLSKKLSRSKYDHDSVEDQVDVDAVLAEHRESIRSEVEKKEENCMNSISVLFDELKDKTRNKFPDLVELIDTEQENAELELKGTFMNYVKEHLSKNDSKFLRVLEMNPGSAKKSELDAATERVYEEAEHLFNSRLKRYTEHILTVFTNRLDNRISDQEKQMNQRIEELEHLKNEAENGQIDIDVFKDNCAPVMETAECIVNMLRTE